MIFVYVEIWYCQINQVVIIVVVVDLVIVIDLIFNILDGNFDMIWYIKWQNGKDLLFYWIVFKLGDEVVNLGKVEIMFRFSLNGLGCMYDYELYMVDIKICNNVVFFLVKLVVVGFYGVFNMLICKIIFVVIKVICVKVKVNFFWGGDGLDEEVFLMVEFNVFIVDGLDFFLDFILLEFLILEVLKDVISLFDGIVMVRVCCDFL